MDGKELNRAMEASEGAEQPDPPILLICTAGGSPQPIATALRLLRPDVAWFLVSDGKTGESSRTQVENQEIVYDKRHNIRGPGLKFADGCPETTRVFEIPADDPDQAYKICRSQLLEAQRRYPEHRLIADYTGGTKSMTGALLMAAFAQRRVEVQFMVGERPDLVQVKSDSEKPQRMSADFIMAERDFAAAELAVDGYDYAAAQQLLDELHNGIQKLRVRPPKAWSHRLQQARAWTGLMAHWDAFNHREAAKRARGGENWLRDMLTESDHLGPLLALGEREKGKPGWDICADLWLNALRRGGRGHYDNAVARLYRLLEAAAQAHLWARYDLESGRIAPIELPDSMRSYVFMNTDPKNGARYAQLALNQTVELLRERDPDDPFVAAYAGGYAREDRLQGPPWLAKRNRSILAHGFVSVDCNAWEEAKSWVETNVMAFFRGAEFPQLPRRIPPLQTTAV
jgi:CRISPR-associated protein (TIGR02710 family)